MNKTLMVVAAMAFAAVEVVAQNANLKIVVIEGEGAVNIIQQKTAVAPVVEIRDRNNVPVSGATVTFSIGGGNSAAFAGGAQTLTVTTNAAGRAVAAALNPLGGGSFQIQVSAAFQGQTAVAAIAQTNVLTIAEAAAQTAGASGAGGAGGSSGGAAAGGASGGGGLSGTTIGILGAAVGGGALAATQVVGGGGDGAEAPPKTYTGSFTGQFVFNQNSGGRICDYTNAITGTVTLQLEDGASTGAANVSGTSTTIAVTGAASCGSGATQSLAVRADVTGAPAAIAFTKLQSTTNTTPTSPGGSTGTSADEMTFSGSLSGGAITGTLTYTTTFAGVGSTGNVISSLGTVTMPVTLR